jgi:hypothetical protein
MRGRCNSIVNRLVRSTRVPIAELSNPEDQIALGLANACRWTARMGKERGNAGNAQEVAEFSDAFA